MTKALDLSLAYKVADMALADFGKKEMQLSEREMPGLMECIRKYGDQKPLKGLRVTGSLHMTIQTGHAHQDPARPGRGHPLGLVQHLLHPGPRRCRHRRAGHGQGLRLEGREPGRLLVVHRNGPDLA